MTIGIIGCGFWAGYQVAAWREADPSVRFAFCDRDASKARTLAQRFGSTEVYTEAESMLDEAIPDVVDIITDPGTHASLTALAAERGLPVICQKPMAPDEATAREMVESCKRLGVNFYIHENFRWQPPIRHLKTLIDGGTIGTPFRARLYFNSSYPVFDDQPALAETERFILADLGVHLLDVSRFLFGEATSLYCLTQRVNPEIRGEDVATVVLRMESGLICTVELSYATIIDYECFPQTLAEVEGDRGSIRLLPDFRYLITDREGQRTEQVELPRYAWADPRRPVAQTAMVGIHRHFLAGLREGLPVETTGEDNLRTLALTYGAYRSAAEGRAIEFSHQPDASEANVS